MPAEAPSTFGFSKDSTAFARRPSFNESLTAVLHKTNPVEPGSLRGGAYLLKQSTTGASQKRFFILHGHYMSYFLKDPGQDALVPPVASLDLWSVANVTLDDNELVLELSAASSGARRSQMGSKVLRNAKQYIRGLNNVPMASVAKSVVNQLEVARRGTESNTMRLQAGSAFEAQLWLKAIREAPLIGSLANVSDIAEADNAGNARLTAVVRELKVILPSSRELVFSSGALAGGDLLVRRLPNEGAMLTVKLVTRESTFSASGKLKPASAHELAGQVVISLVPHSTDVVVVDWERVETPLREILGPEALFGGMFFAAMAWLMGGWLLSFVTLAAALGGAAWLVQGARSGPLNVSIKRILVQRKEEPLPVALLAHTSMTSSSSSPRSTGMLSSLPGFGGSHKHSADLNVTLEESKLLVQLRERCQDFWNDARNVEAVLKRHGKFLQAWGADLNNLKDATKRKRSMDLHLNGADFRAVRFLRARKHNVAKAEQMVHDSLTWRVALDTDSILGTFTPPDWLLNYAGSPTFVELQRPDADFDERMRRFWLRDVDGNLCLFFRQGRVSSRRIYKKLHYNSAYLIKCLVWAAEIGRHDLDRVHTSTKGKVESLVTAVVDLDGFALSNQIPVTELVGLARMFFPIFSTSYPELLKRVIVIRAPFLFASLWSALSPFIPEEVLDKIHILSGPVDLVCVAHALLAHANETRVSAGKTHFALHFH